MKASIPVGIQPGTKILQIEWHEGEGIEKTFWKLWLHHDRLMQFGTYLCLYENGTIERITIGQDGSETVDRIR